MESWDSKFEIECEMTLEQRRYFDWLFESEIHIHRVFNFNKAFPEYDAGRVNEYLQTASSGQIILLQFALMIWKHSNDFDFDLIDAVSFLDKKYIEIIAEWLLNPQWP